MTVHAKPTVLLTMLLVSSGLQGVAAAQDLTPRAYWPAPNGTNVLVAAYQYSSGDIVTDPSLPVTGVASQLNFAQLAFQRTFSLFGRTASGQISLPYSWGDSEGFLEGNYVKVSPSGYGDLRVRFAVNLSGAPSMDGAGFQALRANPRPIIGASLLIQAPTGTYDPLRVLNVGTNRWAIKPAVGLILPLQRTWLLEIDVGTWIFGDNDDFVGMTREQEPILATEVHIVKRFRPGFWASLDANFYVGGRTTVGSDIREDLQRNSRAGVTMVVPIKRHHALRGSFSKGVVTESGGDYTIVSVSYIYAW